MKYYSEKTRKLYDTEADLLKAEALIAKVEAEKAAKEKAAREQRAARAKAVEEALKEANLAKAKANKLLNDFVRDYGSFHASFSNVKDANDKTQESIVNDFVKQVFSFLGEE